MVHESWRKSKRFIFVKFHVPGVMKVEVSDLLGFSCTRGTFILPNYPEIMVKDVKKKVQAFQKSKTYPLVSKNGTNQESEPTSSREWHKKPCAESFITIRPQIAKVWPNMVSPWWPKNELIKKMTPLLVVSGKTMLTLWISLKLDNRRPSYDQKGAPWWPKNELSLNLMAPLKPPRKKKLILKISEFYLKKRQNESLSGAHIWESCSPLWPLLNYWVWFIFVIIW